MVHLRFNIKHDLSKRYLLGLPMAMLGAAGISAGGSILGGALSKKTNPEDLLIYKQLPDYKESEGARGSWWDTLQKWGQDPNYGAIPLNWDEIWKNAQDKISRYYWGGVADTGLAGKIRASAARRGVSDSPALESELSKLGFQESLDLKDLATTQATEQLNRAEQGRQGWLNSLMQLSGLRPSFVTGTGVAQGGLGETIADVSGGIGSALMQYGGQQQQNEILSQYLNQLGGYVTPGQAGYASYTPAGVKDMGTYSTLPYMG